MQIDTPKIKNLTSNGFLKTYNSDGSLEVDTAIYITGVNWNQIGGTQTDVSLSGFNNDLGNYGGFLTDISGQDLSTADNTTSAFITLADVPADLWYYNIDGYFTSGSSDILDNSFTAMGGGFNSGNWVGGSGSGAQIDYYGNFRLGTGFGLGNWWGVQRDGFPTVAFAVSGGNVTFPDKNFQFAVDSDIGGVYTGNNVLDDGIANMIIGKTITVNPIDTLGSAYKSTGTHFDTTARTFIFRVYPYLMVGSKRIYNTSAYTELTYTSTYGAIQGVTNPPPVPGTNWSVNDVADVIGGDNNAQITVDSVEDIGKILNINQTGTSGINYQVNDILDIVFPGGVGGQITVSSVDINGMPDGWYCSNNGTDYAIATNVQTTGSATGTGFSVDITQVGVGEISNFHVSTPGTGYSTGAYIVDNGGNQATIDVVSVDTNATYDIQLNWNSVANITGYRIIITQDTYNGYYGDYSFDIINNTSVIYDGITGVSNDANLTPVSPYMAGSLTVNGPTKIARDVFISDVNSGLVMFDTGTSTYWRYQSVSGVLVGTDLGPVYP